MLSEDVLRENRNNMFYTPKSLKKALDVVLNFNSFLIQRRRMLSNHKDSGFDLYVPLAQISTCLHCN